MEKFDVTDLICVAQGRGRKLATVETKVVASLAREESIMENAHDTLSQVECMCHWVWSTKLFLSGCISNDTK